MAEIAQIRKALMYFSIERYMQDRNISFDPDGKNVSAGWVGTKCPFCPIYDPDPSTHLGVNKTSNAIKCWRCGAKGSALKYVMKLERVDVDGGVKILKQFGDMSMQKKGSEPRRPLQNTHEITLPNEFTTEILPPQAQYLASRKFDAAFLYDKYKLQSAGPIGDYKLRVIVPFFLQNRMVTFTSRDVTNKTEEKYKHLTIEKSVIPPKQMVYNIDSATDTAIIVEGVTDSWRLGDGAIAIMGLEATPAQLSLIIHRSFKRVFVILDAGKKESDMAIKLAYNLSPFVYDVNVWSLVDGDPGELGEADVNHFRKEIFGRIY